MSAELASGFVAPISGGPASTGTILVAPEMETQHMHIKEVPRAALTPPSTGGRAWEVHFSAVRQPGAVLSAFGSHI